MEPRRGVLRCWAALPAIVLVLLSMHAALCQAQDDACNGVLNDPFTVETDDGLARFSGLPNRNVSSLHQQLGAVCKPVTPQPTACADCSCGGAVAGAAVGCLIGGILIGILVDMFVILRLREQHFASKSSKEPDTLAQSIVADPCGTAAESGTFSNPAFGGSALASAAGSCSSTDSGSPPAESQAGLTRKPSVPWPQWVSGGSKTRIASWRASVGSAPDGSMLEEGLVPPNPASAAADAAAAAEVGVDTDLADSIGVPKSKRWLSTLSSFFKRKESITARDLLPEVEVPKPSLPDSTEIINENEMSAILDEVDQLAKEIDDLHNIAPSELRAQLDAGIPRATVAGAGIAKDITVSAAFQAAPATGDLSLTLPDGDMAGEIEAKLPSSLPTPSVVEAGLGEIAERPQLDLPDAPLPDMPAATALAAASEGTGTLPFSDTTGSGLESKSSSKLRSNPFLQGDKKKPGGNGQAKLSKQGSASKWHGAAHLAARLKQEEAGFKRPSLRSVTSTKSSMSSDSNESKTAGVSPSGSVPGGLSAASQAVSPFSKANLRKADSIKKPSALSDVAGANPLQQAMSSLKRTVPAVSQPPAVPEVEKRKAPPEPLPTESQVDLMEEEEDLYIDPDGPVPMTPSPSSPNPGMSASFSAPLSRSFSVDTTAVLETADNYMVPMDVPEGEGGQEDYMDMEDAVGQAQESYIDMSGSPESPAIPEGYMQLQDAVSGADTEYLDMSGHQQTGPPPIAKRKVSTSKIHQRDAAAASGSAAGGKVKAKAKAKAKAASPGEPKTGFFSRLFKGKKKEKQKQRSPSKGAAQPAGGRLKAGWRKAETPDQYTKRLMDAPTLAPPDWVQRLHEQGRSVEYNDDGIYEEYAGEDGDLYEELNVAPRQHTGDKISKPSQGRVLITAEKKKDAIDDLKSTPMPAGNVKRLTSHFVKKQA